MSFSFIQFFRGDVSQGCDCDEGTQKSSPSVSESDNSRNDGKMTAGAVSNTYSDPNDPANFCFTDEAMIKLLITPFAPPPEFKFPATGGRRFAMLWAASRPWIRYSVQNDSIVCSYCVCFGEKNTDSESPFVKKGFKNWKKASGVKDNSLDKHMQSSEHQMAEEKALNWLRNCKPGNDIACKI